MPNPDDLNRPLTLDVQYWHDGNKSETDVLAEMEVMHGLLLTMANLASFYLFSSIISSSSGLHGNSHFLLIFHPLPKQSDPVL